MSTSLKLFSIAFILLIIITVFYLLRKDRISIKYSLVWLIPSFTLLIFTLIPGCLTWTSELLGFQTASNMIFALLIALLLIISIALTVIVSNQKKLIRVLIQEVSILKKINEENNEK